MSHQTGIKANEELLRFFHKCRLENVRLLSVSISNEELCLGDHKECTGTWKDDFDAFIIPMLMEKQPLYIFYRLDTKTQSGFEWILLNWSPDDSPVRQKMLYASTKATIKKEFGSAYVVDEIFGGSKEEMCLKGYLNHKESEASPAPLTTREEEIIELQKLEVGVDIGIDSRQQTLSGVAFPMLSDSVSALKLFAAAKIQYLQLKIDIDREEIHLTEKLESLKCNMLSSCVPSETARYHLYRFDHMYEGDEFHSVVFIYSMPGYKVPIKERMLYSSSKNPITNYIEECINVAITRKMEVSDGSELTEDQLLDEIHPKVNLHKPKFAKPKGPSNRGAKRLTKATQE